MSDASKAVSQEKALDKEPANNSAAEQEIQTAAEDYSKVKGPNGELVMAVVVHSPFRTYYDGPAFSVSAENATGPFDVLPKHHNFITLLSPCDIVIRTLKKGEQKIRISGGIMHVKADRVVVFLDV